MNLANKISITRILMVPIFMVLMSLYFDGRFSFAIYLAIAVFIAASATDSVDGYIARKYNMVTDFGKFIDPLADKLLITAAIIYLVAFGLSPAWVAVIIISREFIVTALRSVAAAKGQVIAASNLGKIKTIVQMVGIVALLLIMPKSFGMGRMYIYIINFAITVITVWSGVDYIVKHWSMISETK